jgi:lipopolysaccharide biosynthesis protein
MNRTDYVNKIEVKFAKYLVDKGYKCNVVIKCNTYDNTVRCPVFNPININKWIHNPNSFAIKWKYMISYLNQNIVNPELNYLTRFLYYGKYGFISEAEKIGAFPKSSP